MSSPTSALQRLRRESTQLAELGEDYSIDLLTVFGSVLRPSAHPHDLDVGVLFAHGRKREALGVRDRLVALTDYDGIDLVVLNDAGPVIRERALVGAEVLFEARASVHANAASAATLERMDTAWLRDLAVETLAQ